MNKKWILGLALLFSVSIFGANRLYVIASSVNLREAPALDARIIETLPIATPLEIIGGEEKKLDSKYEYLRSDWVRVSVGEGLKKGKQGWITTQFVASTPPSVETLLSLYDHTPHCNFKQRSVWMERAIALDSRKVEAEVKHREAKRNASSETILLRSSDGGCCKTWVTFPPATISLKEVCQLADAHYSSKSWNKEKWSETLKKHGMTQQSSCPEDC